jgi:hypothetical protein
VLFKILVEHYLTLHSISSTVTIRARMLTKTELENYTYRIRSELQDLRNELSLLRQNDTSTLKSLSEQLNIDIENLTQRFSESLATLKTEVNLDMNHRKADMREAATETDMRIQEVHHKLVLKLADLRTAIESVSFSEMMTP